MSRRRDIRAERKAAEQRDHSWLAERDDAEEREQQDDEYTSADEFARLAKEFRG
jgi:hypothetical protein